MNPVDFLRSNPLTRFNTKISEADAAKVLQNTFEKHSSVDIDSIVSANDKSLAFKGTFNGKSALVKIGFGDKFFKQAVQKELNLYKYFMEQVPSFNTPKPLLVDKELALLVLEYVEAKPLSKERVPFKPIPSLPLNQILEILQSVVKYDASFLGSISDVRNSYKERFARYCDAGFFTSNDVGLLERVIDTPFQPVFTHGDPNPSNFLFDGKRLYLIDFELTQNAAPMFDVALLWAFLLNDKKSQEQIEKWVLEYTEHVKYFWFHALISAARFERTHSEVSTDNPLRKHHTGFLHLKEVARENLAHV